MIRITCMCAEPEPMVITEEEINKGKTKRRTREIEICSNCHTRTNKPSLTKWKVELIR